MRAEAAGPNPQGRIDPLPGIIRPRLRVSLVGAGQASVTAVVDSQLRNGNHLGSTACPASLFSVVFSLISLNLLIAVSNNWCFATTRGTTLYLNTAVKCKGLLTRRVND